MLILPCLKNPYIRHITIKKPSWNINAASFFPLGLIPNHPEIRTNKFTHTTVMPVMETRVSVTIKSEERSSALGIPVERSVVCIITTKKHSDNTQQFHIGISHYFYFRKNCISTHRQTTFMNYFLNSLDFLSKIKTIGTIHIITDKTTYKNNSINLFKFREFLTRHFTLI